MKRRPEQAPEEVFADFSGEAIEAQESLFSYEILVGTELLPTKTSSDHQSKVLYDYLNRIFIQEQSLNKILYSIDGGRAVFSIGLHTNRNKEIYALFYKNTHSQLVSLPDWVFHTFVSCYL